MKPMMLQRQLPETVGPFRRVLACGPPAEAVALLEQAAPAISGPDATLRLFELQSGEGGAALDRVLRRFERRGVGVTREAVPRLDASALVTIAGRDGYDLVMSGIARGPNEPAAAAARLLVDRCPCPVWLGDPRSTHPPRRIVAAVDPGRDDRTRLLSRQLLTVANAVAEPSGSELHILHAWVPFGEPLLRNRFTPEELAEYVDRARLAAGRAVGELLADVSLSVRREHFHLVRGEVEDELARFVADRRMDLVVIGTRGRFSRLGRALLKPRARQLLQRTTCSTLAIKPPDRGRLRA